MPKMISLDSTLISEEVLGKKFVCDLNACKGACCVEGVSGAPLEKEEVEELEQLLPLVKPYMTREGIKAVEKQGVFVIDQDRELTTPLINGGECAFVVMENNIAKCSIEKAFKDGKIKFKKPISCHLYPIRIEKKNGVEKLQYHKWELCKPACKCGEQLNVKVYQFLKEPLIRKYGPGWYRQLQFIDEKKNGPTLR
jgi:hypothetical protein